MVLVVAGDFEPLELRPPCNCLPTQTPMTVCGSRSGSRHGTGARRGSGARPRRSTPAPVVSVRKPFEGNGGAVEASTASATAPTRCLLSTCSMSTTAAIPTPAQITDSGSLGPWQASVLPMPLYSAVCTGPWCLAIAFCHFWTSRPGVQPWSSAVELKQAHRCNEFAERKPNFLRICTPSAQICKEFPVRRQNLSRDCTPTTRDCTPATRARTSEAGAAEAPTAVPAPARPLPPSRNRLRPAPPRAPNLMPVAAQVSSVSVAVALRLVGAFYGHPDVGGLGLAQLG